MKNLVTIFFVIVINTFAYCQYSFNTTSETYTVLDNPISLNNGNSWDNATNYQVFFNFDFTIMDQTYTAVNVMAGGGLAFPGQGNKRFKVFNHTDSGYLLEDRDQNNSASPISYEITGTTGNQILKIQWENAGFREWCASSDTSDYENFQIWLFENDNHIEIHFGDYSAGPGAYGNPDCNTGTDGPQLIFQFDVCSNAMSWIGPSNLPSYDFRDHCIWQPSIFVNGTPSSGIVYHIIPDGVGIEINTFNDIKIFPNPVSHDFSISGIPNSFVIDEILIIDNLGRTCFIDNNPHKNNNEIHLSSNDLRNGIYELCLKSVDKQIIKRRFIKNTN